MLLNILTVLLVWVLVSIPVTFILGQMFKESSRARLGGEEER